ncbi:Protein of uncharacterised function (DUF1460) (plasmid) [Legionella adelaidensis]|uniref:Protein of uncharacterized function (DUF1460) n=1 Tax=Legionella adelaidensis TaxID=45056 RepID=A0A0W0R681_9GAMM|nr:N-acetylmuramoyl-L-alanine amidase-like domain-containing protein [Legionella adelaidensis]KTC66583.1 hypothetical protein Lade_1241 [Legionella adelaidensis]VEH85490.1 Protein of uncharacterised function (DUF1460) [Legionella adelaidensis]
MKKFLFNFAFIALFLISLNFSVFASKNMEQEADKTIIPLYRMLENKSPLPMNRRLEFISEQFLNKPYLLGALGEGTNGDFDQFPLYRVDSFDCETYVDTVLALALAKDLSSFKSYIRKIRYQDGVVSYTSRNHFTSIDWNLNNQHFGYLEDITNDITLDKKPVAEIATALIEKPNWYQHLPIDNVRLLKNDPNLQKLKWAELKYKGSKLSNQISHIPYLPLNKLFDSKEKANNALFKQIPNGAIIEIVRPNWQLRDKIGTNLNVSHMGFAFWINGVLVFRQASSNFSKTIDVSLIDYLREALKSPTIKGINIQIVKPQEPTK